MKSIGMLAVLLFVLPLFQTSLTGCNLIQVHNRTNFGVKAIVLYPGGDAVVYPDPGSFVEIEANGKGSYSVTVVTSEQWNKQAQEDSQVLSSLLKNPAQLTPDTVRAFQQKLADIQARIRSYQNATATTGLAGCSGSTTNSQTTSDFIEDLMPISMSLNEIVISKDASGNLVVTCN